MATDNRDFTVLYMYKYLYLSLHATEQNRSCRCLTGTQLMIRYMTWPKLEFSC